MQKETKDNYFIIITLSLSIVIVFIIVILSSILYISFIDESKKLMYDAARTNLEQSSASIKFLDEYVEGVALQVVLDKSIMRLASNSLQRPIEFNESITKLNAIRYSSPMIQSIYIYNKQLSNFYVSDTYSNLEYSAKAFYDQEIVNYVSKLGNYKRMSPIPRRIQFTMKNGTLQVNDVYTYIYFDSYTASSNFNNVIIMNISSKWLFNALANMDKYNEISKDTFIIDSKGKVIFSNHPENITSDLSKESYIQEILKTDKTSGYSINNTNKSNNLVTFVKSDYYDWYFISLMPYSSITDRVSKMKDVTIFVSIIIMAIGVITSLIVSKKINKPIKSIFSKLIKLENDKIINMANSKNKLLATLLNSTDYKNSQLIIDELDTLQSFKLNINASIFIIILQVDNYTDFCIRFNYMERKSLMARALAMVEEIINGLFPYEFVYMDNDDEIILVANYDSEQIGDYRQSIYDCLKLYQNKLDELIKVSFSIYVSSVGHTYRDLNYNYTEALKISNFRFALGHKSIIFSEDIEKSVSGPLDYQVQKEKQLTDAIMREKKDVAIDVYKQYISEIGLVPKETYQHILSHMFFVVKSAVENKVNHTDACANVLSNCFDLLKNAETVKEAELYFTDLLNDVFIYLSDMKKAKYDELVTHIEKIIEENYNLNSLCINSIADEVDISSAYLGKVFKQLTSKSLTDHICDIRISKAKDLLINSEISINEVADRCGFTNSSYFYMVFKKRYGMTPNQFRQNS